VTPTVGVPAVANGTSHDTQGEANHLFRMQAIREIIARVLADNDLDALVYPYETIPSKLITGGSETIGWLTYDGRPNRGYNAFTDGSGLPDIGVPAGFTNVVYDRITRGTTVEFAIDPPSVRREVTLPFSVQFLGRPWSEPVLLQIASAYEYARGPRVAPPGFGPVPGGRERSGRAGSRVMEGSRGVDARAASRGESLEAGPQGDVEVLDPRSRAIGLFTASRSQATTTGGRRRAGGSAGSRRVGAP
jgi:hypothetical protein